MKFARVLIALAVLKSARGLLVIARALKALGLRMVRNLERDEGR